MTENERLKARIRALEAELRDLRNTCGASASSPRSENREQRHRSDAGHPRLQMDDKPSQGEINSIDQRLRLLFEPEYYRSQVAARGLTVGDPLTHFDEIGGTLGLSPHPLFNSAFYLESNPDVRNAEANPLRHYLLQGDQENRNPHPLFNTSYYKSRAGID